MRRRSVATLVCTGALGALVSVALAVPENGGFEQNSFAKWNVVNEGSDTWTIYTGGSGRRGFLTDPPEGDYAAVLQQGKEGLNILHRVLRARRAGSKLSFFLSYENGADRFHTPKTLAHEGGPKNQQIRVDLLKPGAGIKSLNEDDILATVFRTKLGDPGQSQYEKHTVNLKQLGVTGRFRFRLAQVDNEGPFGVAFDALKLKPLN
jgi:hypothetical protein